jgi:signal transduction histidine kinase
MLARLSIRQKLSLLLVIPLTAVALVMVGFTAERVGDARAAGATARTALAAREIGALIQTLQQERLLALGYLAAPSMQRSALVTQSQTAVDDIARLAADPNTAGTVAAAKPALDALTSVRRGVINRSLSARSTYDAFRAAATALLDALRLGSPEAKDAQGLGPLVALDALMRSNEEASSVGAIVVGAAIDPALSSTLLTEVAAADDQNLRRFKQLVPPEQASLVDLVENGQAGQRIQALVGQIIGGDPPASASAVSEALTAALTYTGLRRLAQDRVARDVEMAAENRAATAETIAIGVAVGAAVLFVAVVGLGITVTRSISRPLRRLTRAAAVVADLSRAELVRVADSDSPDPAPPRLSSVEVDSADEIGELAAALNRVQATAALLLERQVSTRSNTSEMFANIARRTQNLVGRQLGLIDELERNERDPELLQRLYRLDHVATRLRRSADSLLVVSGTIDQEISGAPTRLADVVRSALAEIEGYRAVQLGDFADVAVSADLVADLRLLMSELLENATNFSPPGAMVEVAAILEGDCYLVVVDHGVGMSAARLEEENRRLVERERLDVAPTRVLGLFVVGRLARRHGLGVRLDPSPGRGVTATVRIPDRLLVAPAGATGPRVSPVPVRPALGLGVVPPTAIEAIKAAQQTGPFPWLARPELVAIGRAPASAPADLADHALAADGSSAAAESAAAESAAAESVAAESAAAESAESESAESEWPGGVSLPPPSWPPAKPAEGDTVADLRHPPLPRRTAPNEEDLTASAEANGNGVTSGTAAGAPVSARAGAATGPSGLSQRIPGTHLSQAVQESIDPSTARRPRRDPEAERDAVNEYLSGLSRGTGDPDQELESRPTLAERHS